MVKRALVTALVLSGLMFSGMAEKCLGSTTSTQLSINSLTTGADAAGMLEQAKTYEKDGYYEQAAGVYKTIVADYSGSDYALEAQKNLAILYIWEQKDVEAQAELDKLLVDYSGHPALPAALYKIARKYQWSKRYEQAESIYQRIIERYPDSPQAGKARLEVAKGGILVFIDNGKMEQARAGVEKIIADFNDEPDLPGTLYKIARRYGKSKEYGEARDIFQQIIQRYPESLCGDEECFGELYAEKAQMDIAKGQILISVELGDEAGAQAGVDKLMTDFSGHPYLPRVLRRIAKGYEKAGKYDKAKDMYQEILQRYPDTLYANRAQLHIPKGKILLLVEAGDDAAALAELDKLIADYPGHSRVTGMVSRIAEQYCEEAASLEKAGRDSEARECLTRAVAIWERAINELAGSNITAAACCSAAVCERKLGEYEKSIFYCQKVIDAYPGYPLRWNALFLVGRNWEDLKQSGAVPESEADAKTKAAYEQLLQEYPDCKAAEYAQSWLAKFSF